MGERRLERVWESSTIGARVVRRLLDPLASVYGAAMTFRNRAYDRGWLEVRSLGRPTVSVGNLTVGGTGKTPIAAWLTARLIDAGARPGVLLRGYRGGDEARVHEVLNPHALVVAGADRVVAGADAIRRGANVLVLDDGFQHRRVARTADVVLLSADRHRESRLLPAGPWREPFASLRRASHIVVTRRRTSPMHAREVLTYAGRVAPNAALAIVHLVAARVRCWQDGEERSLADLAGTRILAVSGVGDSRSFEGQLRDAGCRVVSRAFADHHPFSDSDVRTLAAEASAVAYVVCTLKDAVKIGSRWPPGGARLWYLSQHVSVETGADALRALVRDLADAARH